MKFFCSLSLVHVKQTSKEAVIVCYITVNSLPTLLVSIFSFFFSFLNSDKINYSLFIEGIKIIKNFTNYTSLCLFLPFQLIKKLFNLLFKLRKYFLGLIKKFQKPWGFCCLTTSSQSLCNLCFFLSNISMP